MNRLLTLLLFSIAAQAPVQGFEVASVKLNKSNERSRINATPASGRLVITVLTVQEVIEGAYGIQSFELVNVDSPVLKQRIALAKKDGPLGPKMKKTALA